MRSALIVMLLASQAFGQSQQARIVGEVRDQQGYIVPGVSVVLVSAAIARSTMTNERGEFAFLNLPGGTYDLSTTAPGFRTGRSRVPVADGSEATTSVRLPLGSLTEVVNVIDQAVVALPAGRVAANHGRPEVLLDVAKLYYAEGRFAEAEAMTSRALEAIRAGMPRESATITAQPNAPGPIRMGGAVITPRKIRHVEPVYPEAARVAGVEGFVLIEATVARDGTVSAARVLKGEPQLDAAALQAVRQWRYTPAQLNGAPVDVALQATLNFVLR